MIPQIMNIKFSAQIFTKKGEGNMGNQCKIFISSAYENDLKPFREDLAKELRDSGHLPILFEESFGFWGNDTIRKCIEKVKESDVMLLFISNRSGSFTRDDPNVTATYVEYHTALKENKLIIPFVKNDIAEFYRKDIKHLISREIEVYSNNNGFKPDYTYRIMHNVREYVEKHNRNLMGVYEKTDEFVWSFLYDIDIQSTWMYPIELSRSKETFQAIKEYLSEFIKLGVSYIPLKEEIERNTYNAKMFSDYTGFVGSALTAFKNNNLDTELLLSKITGNLEGGIVYNTNSPYVKSKLGSIHNCSGATLYKRKNEKLVCVSYYGVSTPTKEYKLDDLTSFVAETYKQETEKENMYFQNNKKRLYITRKIGPHVFCTHYNIEGSWNKKKIIAYEKQLLSVIINVKTRLYYDFVFKLIGGLENE